MTSSRTTNARDGFTIIEVMISMVILAVGLLALATTSIFASTQVRVADLKTEQSVAVQQVVERMHAVDVSALSSRAQASAEEIGDFSVWWDIAPSGNFVKRVNVYTRGPGFVSGQGWTTAKVDTFRVEIADLPVD